MVYFNKDWKYSKGGVFQIWNLTQVLNQEDSIDFYIKDSMSGNMNILEQKKVFAAEVVGRISPIKSQYGRVELYDEILPEYNRIVICDFVDNPLYHSITPGHQRDRYAVTQWLL